VLSGMVFNDILGELLFIDDVELPLICNSILVTNGGRVIEFSLKARRSGTFSIE